MSRSALSASSLLIPALFLGSAITASADDAVKDSATSDVSMHATGDGNFEVSNTNRRFETDTLASTLGGPEIIYQLLLIEEAHVSKEGPQTETESVSAKVKVTAYPLGKDGMAKAKFTIDADGDAASVDGPYLTVTRWGCCAEQNTYAIYSLESGAYLFNATGGDKPGQWATLGAQGGWQNERILAYHAAETEADDVVLKGAPNAVIAISYATTTKPLQRILVTVPKEMIDADAALDWAPKLDLVTKDQPDGTDRVFIDRSGEPATLFTDVTARLTLDEKTTIEIPLVQDKLNIKDAKLPQGFGLTEVTP